jgi:hypothetical protein
MIKAYSYAAKLLYAEDAEAVQEQLSLSHEHRNKLTEIVREARSTWRQLIKTHCGLDLEQLESGRDAILEEINATKDAINQWKIEHRSRKTEPGLAAKLKELRTALKAIKSQISELKNRAAQDSALKSLLNANEQQLRDRIRQARAHFSKERGIYWANYMRNEEAVYQACFGRMDPKFQRWTGEGTVAIQIQRGMSVEELFRAEDHRLRLIAPAELLSIGPEEKIHGPLRHIQVLYRIGSRAHRDPVWIELRVTMHRMLPLEGRVKWALLKRTKHVRTAGRAPTNLLKDYDYELQLLTELGTPVEKIRKQRVVAVRTGWTMDGGQLRVATALGTDGKRRTLYLSNRWLAKRIKVQELSSIADSEANRAMDGLRGAFPFIFDDRDADDGVVPLSNEVRKMLREAVTRKDQGRRLANALLRAYSCDPVMASILESWRNRHLHLLRYRKGMQGRLLRSRRELYRLWAGELARNYDACAMKTFDLRSLDRKDLTRDRPPQEVIWCRKSAAVSILRALLGQKLTIIDAYPLLEAAG